MEPLFGALLRKIIVPGRLMTVELAFRDGTSLSVINCHRFFDTQGHEDQAIKYLAGVTALPPSTASGWRHQLVGCWGDAKAPW